MEYRGTKDLGQVFTLSRGRTMLKTGTHAAVNVIYCHEDGSLSIQFPGGVETHTFTSGDCFGFDRPVEVVVSSGTFSFM